MKLISKKLLKEIDAMSISCLFALQNEADKKVSLHMTGNLLRALERILPDLKASYSLSEDYQNDKIKVVILEEIRGSDRKLRLNHWYKHFLELGYQYYNSPKIGKYEIRIEVEPISGKGDYWVLVKIKSSNGKKRVVGVFYKMEEAKEFVEKYYKSGIVTLVYANNPLTKNYIHTIKNIKKTQLSLRKILVSGVKRTNNR